jgi:hypothetical protein
MPTLTTYSHPPAKCPPHSSWVSPRFHTRYDGNSRSRICLWKAPACVHLSSKHFAKVIISTTDAHPPGPLIPAHQPKYPFPPFKVPHLLSASSLLVQQVVAWTTGCIGNCGCVGNCIGIVDCNSRIRIQFTCIGNCKTVLL